MQERHSLADLLPVSAEELGLQFDELSQLAASQPDDADTQRQLFTLIETAQQRGELGQVMQMAMVLGAMACAHPHLEGLAGAAEGLLGDQQAELPHGDHATHNDQTCANCKAEKYCAKKH